MSNKEDHLNWVRKGFDEKPLNEKKEKFRKIAEKETNQDLQKPIQQLICDVHEEADSGTSEECIVHAIKRFASMMGQVSLSQEDSTKKQEEYARCVKNLTYCITRMTVIMTISAVVMVFQSCTTK